MNGWRERLFGDSRRLGWWSLPLFVAVGLLGAVLAGSLMAVYYAQKVEALREETEAARRELSGAVERVSEAAEGALADIEEQVNAVRDDLAVTPPFEDAAAAGVVAVRAQVVVPSAPTAPPAGPGGTEAPPPPPTTEVRHGSGFAVILGDGSSFFVTAHAVVADPRDPSVAVERAEIFQGGDWITVDVHSWDPEHDLALLRADGVARLEIAEWRPDDEPLDAGTRVFAIGLLPTGTLTQLGATVAGADDAAVVLDAAVPDIARGGPVVDGSGRVIAVASTAYRPFGAGGATNPAVPVDLLCQELIRCGGGAPSAG